MKELLLESYPGKIGISAIQAFHDGKFNLRRN